MNKGKAILAVFVLGILIVGIGFSPDSTLISSTRIDAPIACTMDAKICPDGSAVGRIGPNCEFAPCPGELSDDTVFCSEELKVCPDGSQVARAPPKCEFAPCPGETSSGGAANMANPASVKCVNDGGRLAIEETDAGQIGICHFPDGTSCEEWAYFRGVCGGTSSPSAPTSKTPVEAPKDYCAALSGIKQALAKYQELLSLPETELTARGYSVEKLKLLIALNQATIREKYSNCPEEQATSAATNTAAGSGGAVPSLFESTCSEIRNRIMKYKELLLMDDAVLGRENLSREKLQEMIRTELGKYSACTGALPANATLPAVPTLTPCGEAKGLAENVIYYKKLLELTSDPEQRASIEKLLANADAAHNRAVSNCVVKPAEPTQVQIGPCESAKQAEQKLLYLKKLLGLSDQELAETVKEYNRDDLKLRLAAVEKDYSDLLQKCKSLEARASCVPAPERMREYEALAAQLKEANANGETALAEELMQKIRAVKAEINQQSCIQEFQATITKPSEVETAVEISSYYKSKLSSVVSSASGIDSQISSLRDLRTEIDRMIEELVRKRETLDAGELSGLAKMEVSSKGELKVNDKAVGDSSAASKILLKVNNRETNVVMGEGGASLDDGSEIRPDIDSSVVVEEGKLSLGGKEVNVLPGELAFLVKFAPEKVKLGFEDGKAVYTAKATERRRLFWVFPVSVEKTEKIDAGNGESLGESVPWWAALAAK